MIKRYIVLKVLAVLVIISFVLYAVMNRIEMNEYIQDVVGVSLKTKTIFTDSDNAFSEDGTSIAVYKLIGPTKELFSSGTLSGYPGGKHYPNRKNWQLIRWFPSPLPESYRETMKFATSYSETNREWLYYIEKARTACSKSGSFISLYVRGDLWEPSSAYILILSPMDSTLMVFETTI